MKVRNFVSVILIAALGAASQASASTRVKLQWFDVQSNTVDLQWPIKLRWVWSPEKDTTRRVTEVVEPWLQAWIEVPSHIEFATTNKGQRTRVLFPADSEGQLLVFETQNPRETTKLEMEIEESAAEGAGRRKVGVSLNVDVDEPYLLQHESCVREGVNLDEMTAGEPWLFAAIYCEKIKDSESINVYFRVSEDAEIHQGQTRTGRASFALSSGQEPIKVVVAHKLHPQSTSRFEISRSKKGATTISPRRSATRVQNRLVSNNPKNGASYRYGKNFTVGLGGAFLVYNSSGSTSGSDPSEYSLRVHARGGKPLSKVWGVEGEGNFPLFTLLPKVFRAPPSGTYELAARATLNPSGGGSKTNPRLAFGPALVGVKLREREVASRVLWGPQFVTGVDSTLDNKRIEARVLVSPLTGSGGAPFFKSVKFGFEASIGMVPSQSVDRCWDFVFHYDYTRVGIAGEEDADLNVLSLGVQTWL